MRLRRRHLWLLPAILLLLPAAWALRWAWADVLYWQGQVRIEQWRDGEPVTEQAWAAAERGLTRALALHPDNGAYREAMAHLWLWQQRELPWHDLRAAYAHAQARDWFLRTTEARPTWPYTWSRLADMQRRLRQYDGLFDRALERADTLGPWEPGVQLLLADMLVRDADSLTDPQRERLLATAGRGLRHVHPSQRNRMVRTLAGSPWLERACLLPAVRAAEVQHPRCIRVYANDIPAG